MKPDTRISHTVSAFTQFMQAAGNAHRASILLLLSKEEMEIWQLAQKLHIDKPLVSHHLKVLLDSGWIRKEKYGKRAYYTLQESVEPHFSEWFMFATKFEKKIRLKKKKFG